MKIALLNDTHFGARNDNPAFVKYFNRFYDEIFFPYIIQHDIKTLIHLGDVVDRRKFINFETASTFRKHFWDVLWNEKIDTHIIIGNHDTYFKNTNRVNAIENLYTSFDGNNEPWIYTRPKIVTLDGINPIDYTVYGGVGFEYSWQNMAFIRGGTRLYHDTAGLSLGGGLKWNMFAVDYAYVNYGILEETHQFGISLNF